MQSVKRLLRVLRAKREPRVTHVQVFEDGFKATSDDGVTREIKWSEIERIYTYKVDCFGYDVIWLAFEVPEQEELDIPEDAKGFEILTAAMNESKPTINSEWYFEVMQPPFAENLTLLFERKGKA
jgi:hypothetical protein